jgi:hypothetical protein
MLKKSALEAVAGTVFASAWKKRWRRAVGLGVTKGGKPVIS